MPNLLDVGLKRPLTKDEAGTFPFSVPNICSLPTLDVNVPVTL